MELAQYIRLFRKWFWLVLIATVLGGGISFIFRTREPSIYQAETIIAIGRYIESPNPNSQEIRTGMDLAQTYAELVTTYDVLQAAITNLNLPLSTDALKRNVSVRIIGGTSLLIVTVRYQDPILSADIANSLAQQLIASSPTNLTEDQMRQVALLNEQIDALNAQLADSRAQFALVTSELAQTDNAIRADQLTEQRNRLVDQINDSAATIAEFSSTIANLQNRSNALDIVERARVPSSPTGTSLLNATVLGALVGATIAVGFVLLVEYLDDRVRTTERVTEGLGLPVLGAIARFRGRKKLSYPERLITHPDMPNVTAESYRAVRTKLLFARGGTGREKSVYIVTSAGPMEGKSTTASNLAVSLAQAGLRVVLIDADLRRPKIHEIFGLPNKLGLTTLLHASPSLVRSVIGGESSLEGPEALNLKQSLQPTSVPNLKVMTSGFIPANPAEVLGSLVMQRCIDAFRASPNVDLVIIDTPPVLVVADSALLAGSIRAGSILVIDAQKTRLVSGQKAKEQLEAVGTEIVGVVLNRVNPRDEDYSYGSGYGYYYDTPKMPTSHSNGAKS